MTESEIGRDIEGARELISWFGSWPRFLDAEVIRVDLVREACSQIHVHTYQATGKVDAQGFYLLEKHVIVKFLLDRISDCELCGFNHQNVVNGLDLLKGENIYVLNLKSVFGLSGSVSAASVRIEFEPVEGTMAIRQRGQ